MKTLTQKHKRVLFCALVVTLGFSKSWLMTASASSQADLAQVTDVPKNNRKDMTAEEKAADTKKTEIAIQASLKRWNECHQAGAKPAKPCSDAEKKMTKPNIPTDATSAAAKEEKARKDKEAAEKKAADEEAKKTAGTPEAEKKGEVRPASRTPFIPGQTLQVDGITLGGKKAVIDYSINRPIAYQATEWQSVDGTWKEVQTEQTQASITCPFCDAGQATINITGMHSAEEIISAAKSKVVELAKAKFAAEKEQKAKQRAYDNCEKDESDDHTLTETEAYACRGAKIMDKPRDERLSELRDNENDLMELIESGPDGVAKARKYLKALKSSVGGDPVLRQYVSRFSTFASDYSRLGTLARDSSLHPMNRAQDFLAISQIDSKYGNMPGHSEETQGYLDAFSGALVNFAREAETSPYAAYNDYWNHNGTTTLGNNTLNSQYAQNGINSPPNWAVSSIIPQRMAQNQYTLQQQSVPQLNGPAYQNANLNGVPPFR